VTKSANDSITTTMPPARTSPNTPVLQARSVMSR